LEGLKKELKNDIWKIIDGTEPIKKEANKFLVLVIQFLLETKGFRMEEVVKISVEMEKRYNEIIRGFSDYMRDSNGDLLKMLRKINEDYDSKIKPLFEKIELIRNRDKKHVENANE